MLLLLHVGRGASARVPLFLLTVLRHARAVLVDLLVTPGTLAHLAGLAGTVAQRILSLAAHAGFAAVALLREAWRRQQGHRKPEHKHGGQSDTCI